MREKLDLLTFLPRVEVLHRKPLGEISVPSMNSFLWEWQYDILHGIRALGGPRQED